MSHNYCISSYKERILEILGVQLCFRRFPIDGFSISDGRNK